MYIAQLHSPKEEQSSLSNVELDQLGELDSASACFGGGARVEGALFGGSEVDECALHRRLRSTPAAIVVIASPARRQVLLEL